MNHRLHQYGIGCLAAAEKVLREEGKAMHIMDLTRQMMRRGYWPSEGRTPAQTVGAAIRSNIGTNGEASPFKKVAPNTFALND